MGGFGALDLARSGPGRFCAAGGHSAALWLYAGENAPGGFDDATDFARHDVMAAARAGDPSERDALDRRGHARPVPRGGHDASAHTLKAHHAAVEFHVSAGSHDHTYWERNWPAYLRFYASRC